MSVDSGQAGPVFTVDARGEKCPLPVLKTEKAMARLARGETLVVLATDPVARIDIPLYCRQNGHRVAASEAAGVLRFEIVRGGARERPS